MKRLRTAAVTMSLMLAIACILAIPSPSYAAEGYALDALDTCPLDGGGQFDETGQAYVACGEFVRVYDTSGIVRSIVRLPNGTSDAAPSPDGRHIYFFNYGNELRRMNRADDGSWAYDPTWQLAAFEADGMSYLASGSRLHVDAWGDIYIANGGMFRPVSVVKFSPAGTLKNRFGNYGNELGNFTTLKSVASTRDGWTVYTIEHSTGRVQRFDYGLDGEYHVTTSWGGIDAACSAGRFMTPYDIEVDAWGFVYVMDADCHRVQKFDAQGAHLASVQLPNRAYALAVDGDSNVIVTNAEAGWRLRRTTALPGPWPALRPLPAGDKGAPVVTNVAAPGTTEVRDITLTITAADNVGGTGIAGMRVANELGNWGPWTAFATTTSVQLTGGFGLKTVQVQVRDLAGNTSAIASAPVDYRGAADTTAPTINSVTLPASTTSATVTVAVNAGDDTAVTELRMSGDGGATWGSWQPFAVTANFTLTGAYGMKGVSVQVRDAAGNTSAVRTATTNYAAPADTQAPLVTRLTVPATTTSQTVSVSVTATDNVGVTGMRLANEDGEWSAWKPFAGTSSHLLTAGFGLKAVSVQVRDAAGNESGVIAGNVQYQSATDSGDHSAPTITELVVPTPTTTQVVEVGIAASDNVAVTDMRLRNEDGIWQGWKPFAQTTDHTLTAGFGAKIVAVQVRDAAGNVSTASERPTSYQAEPACGSDPAGCGGTGGGGTGGGDTGGGDTGGGDTGGGDTGGGGSDPGTCVSQVDCSGGPCVSQTGCPTDSTPPVVTSATVPAQSTSQTVTVTVNATDNTAVTQLRFAEDPSQWGAWQPFQTSVVYQLSPGTGTKTFYLQTRDGSGNESPVTQISTVLSLNAAPALLRVFGPVVTTRRIIPIRITATDDAVVTSMRFASRAGRWGAWRTFSPRVRYTLTPRYGPKYVYVQVRDAHGTVSNVKRIKVWYVIK